MAKSKHHPPSVWVDTRSAAAVLGCGPKHLLILRRDGLLECGKHWKDIRRPGGSRASYRWHLEHCREILETPPEQR